MRITPDTVQAIWERCTNVGSVHSETFPDGIFEAVDIYSGPGGGHVLRIDGRVFEWELGPRLETRWREADVHSALQGMVLGARVIPELGAALPVRPVATGDCATCAGQGFVDFGEHSHVLICRQCDGLGWRFAAY